MSVAIVGLGLIGGSVLRRFGIEAIGFDADPATRAAARAAGHTVADSLAAAVDAADLVLVAVPFPAIGGVLRQIRSAAPHVLVTDVTSVKGPVLPLAEGLRFVPGHPMAGTQESGFAAADPTLFEGAAWVLCPESGTPEDWLTVARAVLRTGAHLVPAAASAHDSAVARISHLPHVLAASLTLQSEDPLALALAAGSFRDATRVAATRPELTVAMCEANAEALDTALAEQIERLADARRRLRAGTLGDLVAPAARIRSGWPAGVRPLAPIRLDAPDRVRRLLELGALGGRITAIDDTHLHAAGPAGSPIGD